MFFTNPSAAHCQRLDGLANQETGPLIVTNHRVIWVVRQLRERQQHFHPGQKATIQCAQAPRLFQMRFEFVFLRIVRTSVWEICSQKPNSTTLSASSRKLHSAWPAGGVLQATAVILARCSPSISTGLPERG